MTANWAFGKIYAIDFIFHFKLQIPHSYQDKKDDWGKKKKRAENKGILK